MRREKKNRKKGHTPERLEKDILLIIEKESHIPMNYKQIAAHLGMSDVRAQNRVRQCMEKMEEHGIIEEEERGRYKLPIKINYIEGRVDMSGSGNAYIISDSLKEDVYVVSGNLKNALHGDRVKVFVYARKKGQKYKGEVVEILERARSEFVGTLEVNEKFAFLSPDHDRMFHDIFIPLKDLNSGKDGQKAIAKITDWSEKSKNPVGVIVKVLGEPGENETEMHAILVEFGLPYEFPSEVKTAAEHISFDLDENEIKARHDMRNVPTLTIDPEDAKDFDDALSVRKLENGNMEVGVHIADVSYYVKENSIIDKEAYRRATSVYLVDRVVPMLPEELSNGVCSLRPNEDKFCFSVIFEMNMQADVLQYEIKRTVIHSNKRFTYDQAQEVIKTGKGEMQNEIITLHQLASILRKNRFDNGALRVEQTEVKFRIDEKGKPVDVFFKESKEANWLIEEFMLLANKYIAMFVGLKNKAQKQIKTFVYRVHDQPKDEKLSELKRFVANFGYKLDLNTPKTISASINKMLDEVKKKPEADMIENLTIRSMAKAIYTTENIGHYGLSFDYYTHFTSPIRRYPDVMVHRLLQHYIDGGVSVNKESFEAKCKHASEMEKRAADAERASIKYKQVEYLSEHIGQEYKGVITGITEWGVYVEIIENKCEGMIRLRDLDGDYYFFDERNYQIRGTRTGMTYRLGDKVNIRVKQTHIDNRTIDFELMGIIEE